MISTVKAAIKTAADQVADKPYLASVGGGGVAIAGRLTMSDVAMIFGIVTGVIGLLIQFIYTLRKDRRERILFEQQVMKHKADDS